MVVEAVVTDVKERKDNAFLRFKGLGSIYIQDWLHFFPTVMLDRKQLDDLHNQVERHEVLKQFKFSRKEIKPYLNFGQLAAPFWAADLLPEEFVRGHYKRQLWWRLAWPGTVAAVKEPIAEALKERNDLETRLNNLGESLAERTGKSESHGSEVFNKLNQAFENYDGNLNPVKERLNQTRIRKSLSDSLLDERAKLAHDFNSLNRKVTAYSGRLEWDKEKRKYDYFIQGTDWMKVLRVLTFAEREKQIVYTLDLEIPLFATDHPLISWLGSSAFRGDEVLSRDIYTIHDAKTGAVENFKISPNLKSESRLVRTIKRAIELTDPDRIAAFNNGFDLMKLRETGEFDIGDDDSRPVYEVMLDFFERIGLQGKEVEDILRGVQTRYAYLPNKKLKTVLPHATRHLTEMKHKVELSYKEMEAAELAGDFDKIIKYLPMDVEGNRLLMRSPDYLKFSEDCCFLSQFRIPYTWLVYSTRTVKDIFKRFYFERVGTYWETMRYSKKDRQKAIEEESLLKENFKDWFGSLICKNKPGFYEKVRQVYLPVGNFLRKELCADTRKYPFNGKEVCLSEVIGKIFDQANRLAGDSQREFQFSQFTSSLADFMVVDFMAWFKERKKLTSLLEKKEVDYHDFCEKFDYFKDLLRSESEWGLRHLEKGTLTLEGMEKHFNDLIKNFLAAHKLSSQDFHDYALVQTRLDRLSNRMGANYNVGPSVVLETLEKTAQEIKDCLAEKGFKIVGRLGSYLYLTGQGDLKRAPVIEVDTIDHLFVSDAIYYERYGALKGFKLEDEAKHNWNLWEMEVFGCFIKTVLEGNPVGAISDLYNDLDCFRMRKGLSAEKMVWRAQKSGRYHGFEKGENVYFYADEEKFAEAKVRVAKNILKLPFLRKSLTGDLGDREKVLKYLKKFAEEPSIERFGEDLINQLDEKKFCQKLSHLYEKSSKESFDEENLYFPGQKALGKLTDDESFVVKNNIDDFASFFRLMVGDDEHLVEKLYRKYRPVCLRPISGFEPDYEMYMERLVGNSYEGFKHQAASLLAPLIGTDCAYGLVKAALAEKNRLFSDKELEKMLSDHLAEKPEKAGCEQKTFNFI